jgi:hypothetical protein
VSFVTILPMAFVMIAGPQILSAIFLATSDDWKRNSAAFVIGAALSITLFVTLAFLIGGGAGDNSDSKNDTLYVIILVLLLGAMLNTYLKREESEPPKWMGKLQTATPRFSFRLGALLLGIFPTDILTSVAVGTFLAAHGDDLVDALPFIGLTLLFLSLPALTVVALRERGQELLPKIRDWMNTNSWIVNELVLALFVGLTINNLV